MLIDAAFDSIQRNFPKAFLVREDLKFPNLKFKGNPVATIIRNPGDNGPPAMPVGEASPMGQLETELTPKSQPKTSAARQAAAAPKPPSDQPKYTLTHRGELDLSDFVGQGAGTPPRPKVHPVTASVSGENLRGHRLLTFMLPVLRHFYRSW